MSRIDVLLSMLYPRNYVNNDLLSHITQHLSTVKYEHYLKFEVDDKLA